MRAWMLEDNQGTQDRLESGKENASASPRIIIITIITTIQRCPSLKYISDLIQVVRTYLCSSNSSNICLSSMHTTSINMYTPHPLKHQARKSHSATTYRRRHTHTHTRANHVSVEVVFSSSRHLALPSRTWRPRHRTSPSRMHQASSCVLRRLRLHPRSLDS